MFSTIMSHQYLWLKLCFFLWIKKTHGYPYFMDIFLVLSDHSREWKSFVSLLALALYAQTQIYLQVMIQKTITLKSSQPTRATKIDTSSLFIIQVQILSQKFIPLIGNLSQSKEDMRLQGKKWQVFIINYVFHFFKF